MSETIRMEVNHMRRASRMRFVLIFALFLSAFMFQQLYNPRGADAAVANLQQFPANPQMTVTNNGNLSGTFAISDGTNRLLVVVVSVSHSSNTSNTFSALYGGKALSPAATQTGSDRSSTWIGYLKETDIATKAGDAISVTITGAHTGAVAYIASYSGVHQNTPITDNNGFYFNNNNNLAIGPLNVNARGYGIYNWAGRNNRTRTSDDETYTEHADQSIDYGSLRDYGVASKAIAAAGTTNPTITWSGNVRTSVSFVTLNPATITVGDGATPSDKTVYANDTNKAVSSFTLATGGAGTTDTVTGLVIAASGTGVANVAANGVKLWLDNGSVPNEWDATDTQVGTGVSIAGATATFTGLNIAVTNTANQYLVTYNIVAAPIGGRTMLAAVTGLTSSNVLTNNDNTDATLTTAIVTTTVGNGASEPSNVTLAPGGPATTLDAFTLQTSLGTDSVTAVTVTLGPANAFNNIALVEITSDTGATVYGSSAFNPASNTVAITTAALTATTLSTQYKVRITPKTHANMPVIPGASYATIGIVTAITSTNTKSYNDTTSATVTIDNASPANATALSGTVDNAQVTLTWTNPADVDFSQVVIVRRPNLSTDTTQPTEGTTYTLGNAIGTGTVACVVNAPTATCIDSGRANGTPYYYRIFAKDTNGNYSQTGTTAGPYTPVATTTVGNGASEPGIVTLAPGGPATLLDAFTLQTNAGSDSVTAVTVTLGPANAFNNIALVEITSDNGATVYGSSAFNPASNTVSITTSPLTATTTSTQYKVRITPKTHANMAAVPGASYATTGTVTALTCTNAKSYNDTTSATVTIDNASPANATAFSGTAGNAQVSLSWTNPADLDFSQVVVIRRAGSATGTTQPTEGTTYSLGDPIGTGTVACIINAPTATCIDSGLSNGTAYYYRIFAKDTNGNYSQTGTTAGPYTPLLPPTVISTTPTSKGQGVTNQNITITGTDFAPGATASFSGAGVTVNSTTWNSSSQLTANISINVTATTGARNVTVTNPDGGVGTATGIFAVTAVPSVTSTVPSNGSAGIAVNSNVTINWNGNVDCSTINTTNITISSGSWALLSCSGSQAVFYTGGQVNSANYTVTVSTNVKNTSGVAMGSPYQFSYTTAGIPIVRSIIQTYYVPITEPQFRLYARAQYDPNSESDTVRSVISITGTFNGTILYYDHWEDGYEDDISNPAQSTTEIWGDGDPSNGAPPVCNSTTGVCTPCTLASCDVINAGAVTTVVSDINVPGGVRDQGAMYFDGGDKITATEQLVVSRAFWPVGAPQAVGSQLAGAVEAWETSKWGSSFHVPAGTDMPSMPNPDTFDYTAVSIMAQKDGTVVTVYNPDNTVKATATLNQGETTYVENLLVGSTITSTGGTVQVDMLTAYPNATTGHQYEGRLYSLLPTDKIGNIYYCPVSTNIEQANGIRTGYQVNNNVFLYNPTANPITINVACMTGTAGCPGPQVVNSKQAAVILLPLSPSSPNTLTGAKFWSAGGENFYAFAAIDINATVHNWGFNLIPENILTPSVIVGWSPGTTDEQKDANPVWVTPVADTTIYVDYDGDPTTGPNTDPNLNKYDVSYSVAALQSQRVFSPGPAGSYDHSGYRIYTVDGTRLASAWGQDGASSSPNQPTELDLGTTVLPYPSLVAYKTETLIGDYNNNGGLDPGELLQYTIRVHNSGIFQITNVNLLDTMDTNLTYVANTTTVNGDAVPDNTSPATRFPLDSAGFDLVPGVVSILVPGQDIFVVYEATVNTSLPPGTSFVVNNATVSSVSEIFLNTVTSLVEAGVLETTKTSSKNGTPVRAGDTITYTVTVKNTSATQQTGIQLDDPLPAGTTYVSNSTVVTGPRLKSVKDKFNAPSYSNNDGPENWAGNWSESDGGSADPNAGNVRVVNGALRLTANASWASRAVDLTTGISGRNFTTATLTFDFRTSPAVAAGDTITVEYYNGGGWASLGTITGITGQTTGSRSYSIPYLAANSAVRFRISAGYATTATDFFYADNVGIKTDEITNVTKDNISGGTYADLSNGTPPVLVAQGDGFALAPGETLTVSYNVLVNNPVNETRIVNIATAISYEKAPPSSSTTIDPVSYGGTIGGLVWLDTAINGFVDYGEPGLQNIRVWLEQNGNGLVYSETLTGTDGKYIFEGLPPGNYIVHVDETTLPAGLTLTTNNVNPSSSMTITGREDFSNVNFGYKNSGSGAVIGNYVWSDANNDGMQDPGEAGLGGVTMQLVRTSDSAVIATTTTNAFGIYFFTNVSPDTYIVKADTSNILTGYSPTTGYQSVGSKTSGPIAVASGDSPMDMDFGFNNPSLFSINDRVWFDQNDSGAVDSGEPGIGGITVKLLSGGNVVAVTTSDPNGNFSFPGLPNGSYTIIIEDAAGKLVGFTGTTSSAQTGSRSVTISNSSFYDTSFGYNAPGRIGYKVWNDANKNGLYDTGEIGIPNAVLKLYLDTNGDGVFDPSVDHLLDTKTTDANGDYMFQVTQTGRFFVNVDYGQTALNGFTLTTTDDQTGTTAPGAQTTVVFLNLNTSYLNANYGFGPDASALDVTKTASPAGVVEAGQQITYTITVTNNSATPQSGITIIDPLPANTTYVSQSTVAVGPSTTKDNVPGGTYPDLTYGDPSSPSNPSHYLAAAGDGFTLDQNQSLTVTYTVTVNTPLDPGIAEIINVVNITSTESPQPKYTSVTSPVKRSVNLSVTKTISQISNPCVEGTCSVTFTITVTNVGETDISSASVSDLLPSQLSWRSDTGSGAYNNQTGVWTIGNITNNGDSASIDITSTVITIGNGQVQNCAALTASVPSDTYAADDQSCASFVPTYVVLSGFRAFVEDGSVVVEWETTSEHDTVGFYIERYDEKTGKYVRLNKKLLPGLVLSPAGGVYRLLDEEAVPYGRQLYKLVEATSKGNLLNYGPFPVDLGGGADAGQIVKKFSSDGLTRVTIMGNVATTVRNTSKASGSDFQQLTSTYSRKPHEASPDTKARLAASQSEQETTNQQKKDRKGSALKVSVSENDVYYIDSSDIATMLAKPPQSVKQMPNDGLLALSTRYGQVSYLPAKDNAGIFFYGTAVENIYTKENIYWLSNDKGLPMESVDGGTETLTGTTKDSFTETLHLEQDLMPAPASTTDPVSDYWFWDYVIAGFPPYDSLDFSFTASSVSTFANTAKIKVKLMSITSERSHALISLNGTPVTEETWYGIDPHTVVVHVEQSLLKEGDNTLTVKASLDADVSFSFLVIDSFDIEYARMFEAIDDQLTFKSEESPSISVKGFSVPDITVFDISDSQKPKLVTATSVSGEARNYTVKFYPVVQNASYIAFATLSAKKADAIADLPSDLKDKNNTADYIVITPEELKDGATTLADYRKSKGLDVRVVLIEDIMDEFNFGMYDPNAIRNFLQYAYTNWKKKPQFAVLLGSGTYDYKDAMGFGGNLMPPLMVGSIWGLVPSDSILGDFTGDNVPEIVIGRIPALTSADLQANIDKIKSFESNRLDGSIMLADSPDGGGDFPKDSDDIAEILNGKPVQKIYLSDYSFDQARGLLFDGINSGVAFVNYMGHAGIDRLSQDGLLTSDDASLMNNNRYPVLTALSCMAGHFAYPGYKSLSELLLVKKGGGIVAAWAPSDFSYNADAKVLGEGFYNAVIQPDVFTLGDAVVRSMAAYRAKGRASYELNIFNLLGDPALRIK